MVQKEPLHLFCTLISFTETFFCPYAFGNMVAGGRVGYLSFSISFQVIRSKGKLALEVRAEVPAHFPVSHRHFNSKWQAGKRPTLGTERCHGMWPCLPSVINTDEGSKVRLPMLLKLKGLCVPVATWSDSAVHLVDFVRRFRTVYKGVYHN